MIAFKILFSFVILETIASVYSKDVIRESKTTESCVSMHPIDKDGSFTPSSERDAEIISFNCLKTNGEHFVQFGGNLTLNSKDVACGKDALYEYSPSTSVSRLISGAQRRCKSNGKIPICIYYEYVGNQFFINKPLVVKKSQKQAEFLSTKMYFNISRSLPNIINRILDERISIALFLSDKSNEELHFRRRIFTNVVQKTQCKLVKYECECECKKK